MGGDTEGAAAHELAEDVPPASTMNSRGCGSNRVTMIAVLKLSFRCGNPEACNSQSVSEWNQFLITTNGSLADLLDLELWGHVMQVTDRAALDPYRLSGPNNYFTG